MNNTSRRDLLLRVCLGMFLFAQSYTLLATGHEGGEMQADEPAAVATPADTAAASPPSEQPETAAADTAAAGEAARKKAAMERQAHMQQMREQRRKRAQNFQYPAWPKKDRKRVDRIPPPPPGPYMSTAMNGIDAQNLSVGRAEQPSPIAQGAKPSSPMEQFSPDLPWPSLRERPQKWQPEAGYHFVKPMEMQPGSAMRQAPPRAPSVSSPRSRYPVPAEPQPYQGSMPSRSVPPPYPQREGYYKPERQQRVPYRSYP